MKTAEIGQSNEESKQNDFARTCRYLVPDASHDTWYCMFEIKYSAARHSTAPQGKVRHRTAPHGAALCMLSWECICWRFNNVERTYLVWQYRYLI